MSGERQTVPTQLDDSKGPGPPMPGRAPRVCAPSQDEDLLPGAGSQQGLGMDLALEEVVFELEIFSGYKHQPHKAACCGN